MSNPHPGWNAYSTAVTVGSLGFVPVAVRFRIFPILSELGTAVSGKDVRDAYLRSCSGSSKDVPPVKLIEDTLTAMAALSWAEIAGEDMFRPNEATHYFAKNEPSIHDVLLGSAFLMRKLEATGFEYPFTELSTPIQHAYHLMGNEKLAGLHTYAIMAAENRIASFNTFMQGRFGMEVGVSERLTSLGYDLGSVVQEAREKGLSTTMVDIGGGRGDLLLDLKKSIPRLQDKDLIVQEFNPDITEIPGLTLMSWDYSKEDHPQPVLGALIYHLAIVLHNLPDLAAARLLQKISRAMAPYSRVLIHERLKENIPAANATMIVLFGGRERNVSEWRQLAELAGLRVTFSAFPKGPTNGVIEMIKVSD